MTALRPRPYQREAIDAVYRAHQERGIQRPLVVLPTGSGKTVCFANIAARRIDDGPVLVIAHREELLTQARDKIMTVAPDLTVGIVKAGRDECWSDVVVASIQTIARPKRLAPLIGRISTVIVDEAHHGTAQTYRDVLEGLGSFRDGGPLTIGFTATAGRGDGVGLGHVWQEIVYQRGILHMIAEGYLVDVKALEVLTDLDYKRVRTNRGDFTDASLGMELEGSGAIEASALAYARHAKERRGVAFTPTIATAHDLAKHLTSLGVRAEALSGETPGEQRRAILRRLGTGETQVVANCGVLLEGFDEPAISCVLVARPTKSKVLFTQMVGRALRPHAASGKTDALVLAMCAPPEAGLATIADLAGLDPEQAPKPKEGEGLVAAALREEAEARAFGKRVVSGLSVKELNLFARSGLRWLHAGDCLCLPCGETTVLLVPDGDRWSVVEQRRGESPTTVSRNLTLEWAQGVGEEYARGRGGRIARADAGWRARPVSAKQRAALTRMRLPVPATSGEASDAMTAALAARTAKTYLRQLKTTGKAA